jgi:dipeptidyl aminopeptidase/acylaminoacyl peptidase
MLQVVGPAAVAPGRPANQHHAEAPFMSDSTRRGMVPQDLTRIRFVSDPQLSPDGKRVAFVVSTLSEDKDENLSNIWVVDVAGGEPRKFTGGPKRDQSPRWSPDGTRLAFISEREAKKKPQLYVMPADGGEPSRLTDVKQGAGNPVWSPDGARIAFVSKTGGWEEPEDEEEKKKSKPARVISEMKYKMNGEGFVYDRRPHLFVVSAGGGEAKQITDGDSGDTNPVWSPDGKTIAFTSARHDDRDHDNATDIFVVSAEGPGAPGGAGEPRRVTDTAGPVSLPSFSPDGRTIAYLGQRYLSQAGRNTRVFTIPTEGGAATCLTPDLDRTCQPFFGSDGPLWSGDGQFLSFAIEDQGDVPVYRVRAGGSTAPTPIITGERQVTGFSVSQDGKTIAFAATSPTAPNEIFVCNADGGGERQLTDLNRDWKAEVALSMPERFKYERAGFTLDCWVMKPANFEPGRRYPTILNVHGGPATQYGHNFFDEFQVQCGAGYVVVYTNPRGSQGYGEEFTRAVIGDWGGGDFDDVMAGMDTALANCDFIDPERLGVQGGSYGGFMTSWTIGHTNRFKAACSERALNTHYSMFGSSDIGHSFPEMYSGGELPYDNIDWYLKQSPLTYAKQIETPVLIMHSEEDLRCPMEQAEQLFIALKKQRKEVLFIRFPDESHELSRSGRPRHRLERFRHILDWFGKYLQPEQASVRETVATR